MRLLVIILAAPLAVSCFKLGEGGEGALFAAPPAQAQAALTRLDMPPLVFGDNPPDWQPGPATASQVVWLMNKDGAEVMRYIARLAPEGEGTRITLDIEAPESGRFGNVRERLSGNPTVRNLYLVAMREQIASALEHRPYDFALLMGATRSATFANIGDIAARMDRAAEAYRRQDRENIEKAYRDEAAGKAY